MCEFCHEHGEGKKWYLQAKNYSDDLLSDVRRQKLVATFNDPQAIAKAIAQNTERMDRLNRMPGLLKGLMGRLVTRKMKKVHFGQVVPVEEIEEILSFTNSVVRLACVCRSGTVGAEKRYCYAVSLAPDGGKLAELIPGFEQMQAGFRGGPDTTGLERLTREEAVMAFHAHEREGLCHTVWTFYTPFIAGICNCDRHGCLAMRSTLTHDIPVMFRAEYVAGVESSLCTGCRKCISACQFGAVTYSASVGKAVVDQRWCYGCGVCRSACGNDAIRLEDRAGSPVASRLW
jgi:Pyruvate/2-oxoacid:ferredoxin oxidoreductase delta subunit